MKIRLNYTLSQKIGSVIGRPQQVIRFKLHFNYVILHVIYYILQLHPPYRGVIDCNVIDM